MTGFVGRPLASNPVVSYPYGAQQAKYEGVPKYFRTETITKYTPTFVNTLLEGQHKGFSSSSRRPIRKFLFTPSYADCNPPNKCYFFLSSDGFLEVLISVELTHNEAASELWTVIDFSFLFRDLPGTNRKPFFHLFPI